MRTSNHVPADRAQGSDSVTILIVSGAFILVSIALCLVGFSSVMREFMGSSGPEEWRLNLFGLTPILMAIACATLGGYLFAISMAARSAMISSQPCEEQNAS